MAAEKTCDLLKKQKIFSTMSCKKIKIGKKFLVIILIRFNLPATVQFINITLSFNINSVIHYISFSYYLKLAMFNSFNC